MILTVSRILVVFYICIRIFIVIVVDCIENVRRIMYIYNKYTHGRVEMVRHPRDRI